MKEIKENEFKSKYKECNKEFINVLKALINIWFIISFLSMFCLSIIGVILSKYTSSITWLIGVALIPITIFIIGVLTIFLLLSDYIRTLKKT